MNFDDVIYNRRSIRKFTSAPVEKEKIAALLSCAQATPSAKNRQPWYFSVLTGETKEDFAELLKEQADTLQDGWSAQTAAVMMGAPVLIVVSLTRENFTRTDVLSVGAAIYGICLKATDLGLGSLWIGDTDILENRLKEYTRFGTVVGAIAIGYAEAQPAARPRKSLKDITNFYEEEGQVCVQDDIRDADLSDEKFVFCSYSHADKEQMQTEFVELKRHGIPIWYDKALDVGKPWDKNALAWLKKENCRAMLFYVSPRSLSSENVRKEFITAVERQKTDNSFAILPIHLEDRLLSNMLEEVKAEKGAEFVRPYFDFFGSKDTTLFIKRSVYAHVSEHIQKIAEELEKLGVIADGRVYDDFSYEIKKGICRIKQYKGFSQTLRVPEFILNIPVTVIGEGAFVGNAYITEVVLPSTVKIVEAGAFRDCKNLTRVFLPDSIEEIWTAAFRDCTSLAEITLPPKLTYLAEALFRGCSALKKIVVPEGVRELKEAVFRHCHSLEEAYLPTTLEVMTEGGFFDCPSLRIVKMPKTVRGLEAHSFDSSPNLQRLEVGGFLFEKGSGKKI